MTVTLRHPRLGTLTLVQQSLRSGAIADQLPVTHTAPAGTADAHALALAAHLSHEAGAPAGRR